MDVFGYFLLDDFRANEYEELDGTRPFHLASDFMVTASCLLKISQAEPPSTVPSEVAGIDASQYYGNSFFKSQIF